MPTPSNSENISQAGYVVFDGTSSFTGRTFQAGTGISLTNASGTAGNTTITATGSILPNSNVTLYDDFFGFQEIGAGAQFTSNLLWIISNATNSVNPTFPIDNGHPGVLTNNNPIGAAADSGLALGGNGSGGLLQNIILGGGVITVNWVFKIAILSTGTNTYTLRVGLGDTFNSDQANGCYFEYTNGVNSGNWQYKTAASSVRTTSNSSVAATVAWHNAQLVVNAAASSVSFTMDGVSLGTAISTNIPTTYVTPFFDIVRSAGTIAANTYYVDLFYMNQVFTSAR